MTVPSYGVITCLTTANPTYNLDLSKALTLKVGDVNYDCANDDPEKCNILEDSSASPTATSVTLSSNQFTITGTSFPTDSIYTVYVIYNNAEHSGTVVSSEEIQATFTGNGVPLATSDLDVRVEFRENTSPVTGIVAMDTQTVANAPAVSTFTPTVSCSYAGGCEISVTAPGIVASVLTNPTTSYIDVCGNQCLIDTTKSAESVLYCTLPELHTTYSVSTYSLGEEVTLTGTLLATNSADQDKLIDGKNIIFYTDDTETGCYVGIQLKENHVGVLTEAKYYIGSVGTYAPYVDSLILQGSQDGVTYTDIYTVGAEVHEGWNVYSEFDESSTYYRYYRYYGTQSGSCAVTEIKFLGNEVVEDSNETKVCTAGVMIDSTLVEEVTQVTYSNDNTYLLESITPRYGSVVGGQEIVFASSDILGTETVSIWLEDIECASVTVQVGSFTCTSSPRIGSGAAIPTFKVYINDKGEMAQNDLMFMYVSYWSESSTWGNDFQPIEGDSVSIPAGLHLLLDIDVTPLLNTIIVEGSLIMLPDSDSTHERELHAHIIMV